MIKKKKHLIHNNLPYFEQHEAAINEQSLNHSFLHCCMLLAMSILRRTPSQELLLLQGIVQGLYMFTTPFKSNYFNARYICNNISENNQARIPKV